MKDDGDFFILKGHGPDLKQAKADKRADRNRRYYQYWRHRNAHECVDCGAQDARTLDGRCRCLYCQKKHTGTKAKYRRLYGREKPARKEEM